MAVTRKLGSTTDGQPIIISLKDDSTSIFGTGNPESGTAAINETKKRKITDPVLELITIDKKPDLTLIVGAPGAAGGQKGFCINSGSFRNACDAWRTMLNGDWAESGMSEIRFPDDAPFAFKIILHIAHWQLDAVPATLTRNELVSLAELSDKYDLQKLFRPVFDIKQWLKPYRGTGFTWPTGTDLQDFIFITLTMGYFDDYNYLVNRLAMEVQVENGCYHYTSSAEKKVPLRLEFPTGILALVEQVRTTVLREFLQICKTAMTTTLAKTRGTKCGEIMCPLREAGMLLKGFQAAGLYPLPENEFSMHGSVITYWSGLKKMGAPYLAHIPSKCKQSFTHPSNCYEVFDISKKAKVVLQRHTHGYIWKQWQTENIV